MRSVRALLAAALAILVASCASDVRGAGLAINDPLDLIDDVEGPLRLYVLPAGSYACDDTTGLVSPEVPDLAEGMFDDAVADLSLTVSASMASAEVSVPGGEYVVLVRGKGTDPVSGVRDTFIATGCASPTIGSGETREVRITLIPIVGMGMCGDGVLSPDEQCEDSNTMDGDGCTSACRTESIAINTTTDMVQNNPSVAGAPGQRWIVTYDSNNQNSFTRMLEADGGTIATPSVLAIDANIDDIYADVGMGAQLQADVAVGPGGRIAMAFADFIAGRDIRVAFLSQNRAPEGPNALVIDGMATRPQIAFAGDGSAMVVFEDVASATGLSGQVFASGSTTPASATPFPVGQGTTGGARPKVAGASDHFVVAFSAGGDVYLQRFAVDGSARDASAVAVIDGAGTQSEAAVAAQADGRVLVAWSDDGPDSDGAGRGIRARAYAADGTPADPFVVNTTTAGDQTAPALTAGGGVFALGFVSGTSVRGRILSGDGDPIPNRDQPPTTRDFEISASGTEVALSSGGSSTFLSVWREADDVRGRLLPLP